VAEMAEEQKSSKKMSFQYFYEVEDIVEKVKAGD
jgi:hypothetical protein